MSTTESDASHKEQVHKIGRYTRLFFSGTLLSRLSGMGRDISMAALFGDHPSVAAFMVAFRFSHFLRRILGEGTLQALFIPHYQEIRLKEESRAAVFFFRLTLLLSVLILALIILTELGVLCAHHYSFSDGLLETARLFAWMFPSLLFISLYGLNSSVLQCENSFFLSSVAPLACNLIWIAALFASASFEVSEAMLSLALFTGIGFIVQWAMTLPKTGRLLLQGFKESSAPYLKVPQEIKTIGKATLFGLIGVTAVQINSFLDMIFARYSDLKGPVYLWYAIRLEQLPLALIGFACVYSVIPSLSRMIKAEQWTQTQSLFLFGYRRVQLLVLPCTLALCALGFGAVNLLFGRGQFSHHAVIETTFCLWAYGASLLPATLTLYLSSLLYAHGDYRTPTWASLSTVGFHLVCNSCFVFLWGWGAISIALSTSLSAWVNYRVLKSVVRHRKYPHIIFPKSDTLWKTGLCSLIALSSCMGFDHLYLRQFFYNAAAADVPHALTEQLIYCLGQSLTFISVFALSLFCLSNSLFYEIKHLIYPSRISSRK